MDLTIKLDKRARYLNEVMENFQCNSFGKFDSCSQLRIKNSETQKIKLTNL